MQLAKVAAKAPKRSPTPLELAKQRVAGVGTLATVSAPTTNGANASASVAKPRSSGRMSPPPNPTATQSSETQKRSPVTVSREPAKASVGYHGGLGSAFAGTSHGTATLLPPRVGMGMGMGMGIGGMGMSMGMGMGMGMSMGMGRPPPTLGMPFHAAKIGRAHV